MVFLFILPFPGTVALRLTCLAAAFLIVVISWRRLTPPPFPCKWAIALWAGVAIASLHFAVDPAYSLDEIKNEVGYALMAFVAFFAWTRDEKQLRLSCLAVLAGFAVISGSALLGADLRKGEWPSDVYYGGVGERQPLSRHGRPRSHVDGGAVCASTFEQVAGPFRSCLRGGCLGIRSTCSVAGARVAGRIGVRLALASPRSRGRPGSPGADGNDLACADWRRYLCQRAIPHRWDPDSPLAMGKDLRPRVWKKIGEEILAHPLSGAGFGLGVMSKAYPALLSAEGEVFWHPHNLVLNYGMSAGVPGMVAVLALFAALAWRFWQLALRGGRLARLTGLAGASMVAGVFARNMTNDFFVRDGALLFWSLAGMLFGYALRHRSTSGDDQANPRQAWRAIVVC